MNEKQIAWVNNHIEKMRKQIESKGAKNLTDNEWKAIVDYMDTVVKQAKGFESQVRTMLFDFIEVYAKEPYEV